MYRLILRYYKKTKKQTKKQTTTTKKTLGERSVSLILVKRLLYLHLIHWLSEFVLLWQLQSHIEDYWCLDWILMGSHLPLHPP